MKPDFNAVERQLVEIARKALSLPVELRDYDASELISIAARPFTERLNDPREALEYAARQIGETSIALAGFNSLHTMFDSIEEHIGEHEALWICRSWVGLTSLDGRSCWSD